MGNMIEQVAMAVHRERQKLGYGGKALWENELVEIKCVHRATARAAINAMRVPTNEMIERANWVVNGSNNAVYKAYIAGALEENNG